MGGRGREGEGDRRVRKGEEAEERKCNFNHTEEKYTYVHIH